MKVNEGQNEATSESAQDVQENAGEQAKATDAGHDADGLRAELEALRESNKTLEGRLLEATGDKEGQIKALQQELKGFRSNYTKLENQSKTEFAKFESERKEWKRLQDQAYADKLIGAVLENVPKENVRVARRLIKGLEADGLVTLGPAEGTDFKNQTNGILESLKNDTPSILKSSSPKIGSFGFVGADNDTETVNGDDWIKFLAETRN